MKGSTRKYVDRKCLLYSMKFVLMKKCCQYIYMSNLQSCSCQHSVVKETESPKEKPHLRRMIIYGASHCAHMSTSVHGLWLVAGNTSEGNSLYIPASVMVVSSITGRCPRSVMVKALDCRIIVSEFELQSRYGVGKGMNLFYPLPPFFPMSILNYFIH